MQGSLIEEQGRGYVMYSGPDQAMASDDAVACIKTHALRVSALASRFGRSHSGRYFTPAIQFTPIILHPHICRALLLLHARGHDQPSLPTAILMPTPAAITYGQLCTLPIQHHHDLHYISMDVASRQYMKMPHLYTIQPVGWPSGIRSTHPLK